MNSLTLSEIGLLQLVSLKQMTADALRPFVRLQGLMARQFLEERQGFVYITAMGREAMHAFGNTDQSWGVLSAMFSPSPRRQFRDLRR